MDYNKIKEILKKRNIPITEFITDKAKMSIQGFNNALKKETLTVKKLEQISNELKLPMSYWWEVECRDVNDPTMQYGNRYEGEINALKMLIKELQELKQKNNEKLDQQEAEIKMLNTERRAMLKERQEMIDKMEELRRSCGLKKEGTSGL